MKKVAILGASGQIGTSLAHEFGGRYELFLFGRDVSRTRSRLAKKEATRTEFNVFHFDEFEDSKYDVVINAVGPGDPSQIRGMGSEILRVTERFDNRVLDYLSANPDTTYIFLSTGAVYGNAYREAATQESVISIPVNNLSSDHFYPMAKLVAEAKHRALTDLSIADIRIFGFFSRHIDLGAGFFLSELSDCIVSRKVFDTNSVDFVRDYICGDDLASLISLIVEQGGRNGAFDIFSAAPVCKFELLDELAGAFDLEYRVDGSIDSRESSVPKPERISQLETAGAIGYRPSRSSLELVKRELGAILEDHAGVSA